MAQTPEVAVVGLKAIQRDLKRMTGDNGALNQQLRDVARTAMAPVQSAVAGALPRTHEHRKDGHDAGTLAGSLRILSNTAGAKLVMGRAKVNWAGPTEFGGYPAGRDFVAAGRYMYPAAEPLAQTVASAYGDGVQRVLDGFDWTNTGGAPHD